MSVALCGLALFSTLAATLTLTYARPSDEDGTDTKTSTFEVQVS